MGMLVDNAIVVAEGMMLRMATGSTAKESASFIVKRTQWPLLGATVLSNDATGEFLYSLFAVVLVSLMISWVLAVTLVPVLGAYFYRKGIGQTTGNELSASQRWFKRALLGAPSSLRQTRRCSLCIIGARKIEIYVQLKSLQKKLKRVFWEWKTSRL